MLAGPKVAYLIRNPEKICLIKQNTHQKAISDMLNNWVLGVEKYKQHVLNASHCLDSLFTKLIPAITPQVATTIAATL